MTIDVAARLMRDGRVSRSRLGIAGQTVPLDRRVVQTLGLSVPTAVMIAEVIPGGPAERDGLMKGDVLLRLGGKPITGADDLHRLLIADLVGTQQPVEILRAGRLVTRALMPELDA